MKKILYMTLAAIAALSSCSSDDTFPGEGGYNAIAVKDEGSRTNGNLVSSSQFINGHEYVVLAGTKWATENVMASGSIKRTDWDDVYGDYFTQENTMHRIGGGSSAQEAAESWGSRWKLPTDEQWKKLLAECDFEWQTEYEHKGHLLVGYLVKGRGAEAGNSIFLPAAGDSDAHEGLFNVGMSGLYWSADDNHSFYFTTTMRHIHYVFAHDRELDEGLGLPVRAVAE